MKNIFLHLSICLIVFAAFSCNRHPVVSVAMEPTFTTSDKLRSKTIGADYAIKRGEVAIFSPGPPHEQQNKRWFFRVIGLPGETITIQEKEASGIYPLEISINGKKIQSHNLKKQYKSRAQENGASLNQILHVFSEEFGQAKYQVGYTEQQPFGDPQVKQVKLAPGEYFLLGDNRHNSKDSRFIGPVKRNLISAVVQGKVE